MPAVLKCGGNLVMFALAACCDWDDVLLLREKYWHCNISRLLVMLI